VRAGVAVLAFRLLADGRSPAARAWVWGACALVFAAPVSAFNVLCGMQVGFFMAEFALLWALRSVLGWERAGGGTVKLIAAGVLGLVSLGSAIAIPAATLTVHLLQRRERPGFLVAWVASVLPVAFVAEGGGTSSLLPSWPQALFFLRLLSWPVLNAGLGACLLVCAAVWVWRTFRRGGCQENGSAAGAALAVFAGANTALLALNRLPHEFHSRHWDTVSLGTLGVIAVVAGLVAGEWAADRRMRWAARGLVVMYAAAFVFQLGTGSLPYLREARITRSDTLIHYRNLFLSGNIQGAGMRINDRLVERDYAFFDDPVDRFVPHPTVVLNIAANPMRAYGMMSPDIFPVRGRSPVAVATDWLIRAGWLLLPAGAVMAWRGFRRRACDEAKENDFDSDGQTTDVKKTSTYEL
jgi:hypothetical protein